MNFVILTDTHFVPPGRKIYGLDPAERLAAAVEKINASHPDIAFVIVTGDLAHWGEDAAYGQLATVLGRLEAPSILMMGNHDRRDLFSRHFPGVARDAAGFVQCVQVFDAATIVTLDTLDEEAPNHAGLLCEARLAFLEHALASAPADRPLLLFQHHPPFDTGLRYMDTIRLTNPQAEWEVIARTRKPDYLFMGHLHRPIAGAWRGIPFHIQRALAHQVAFDLEAEGYIPGSHEPPDYSHVTVSGDRIVIHQCSFLYDGPAFSLQDQAALNQA
ncbi:MULTISPECIES: phosphodiesterase [Rhodopseudomonas]|uniref:3',5'-cyclic-nucleotide phosphodiesterase n=1 Tax=Rhodopseudomonas palustris TaxID=1076 RepID=A0A0D7ESW7_RHOPL|nr:MULTISPECIES: phosphodiesterase [Rhodopseudomonas]KIZ43736.1 3',5'-cyclic-nucleotide phosphodiesterase [Rhodopseudomonas palustris]MDF3813395.1 phosphodiesterase [Rhodopseudomonas sp. BAL398]WOK15610.1 phosphodiesterase [Rhodopseudomonas sp. BAL398]